MRSSPLVQSASRSGVSASLVRRAPSCRWRLPRLHGIPHKSRTSAACRPRMTPSHQAWPLPSSFARLDRDPAPQRRAALMDFRSLQHIKGNEVHTSPAFQAGYVPPSGFGYPRDGLLPSHPGRFYFIPAALMGFALRSFLLQGGSRRVSATLRPHAVGSQDISLPKAGAGSREPRLLGFDPPRSPWLRTARFGADATGCSLGIFPSRAHDADLDRTFARSPLARFRALHEARAAASQGIDRSALRLVPGPARPG